MEMSQILIRNPNPNNKKSVCFTKHIGIKCSECGVNPIVGFRYKCMSCNNYNLCENCESNDIHSYHNFIKLRKKDFVSAKSNPCDIKKKDVSVNTKTSFFGNLIFRD